MLKINVKDNELNMEVAGDIKTITKEFCIAAMSLKEKLDSTNKMCGSVFASSLTLAMACSEDKDNDMEHLIEKMVRKVLGDD